MSKSAKARSSKAIPAKTRPSGGVAKAQPGHASGAADAAISAVFESYPKPVGARLRALRKLILETAQRTAGVGPLEEALKWGQVSYLTSESKSGSTIRIDQVKEAAGQTAIYFHCQTNLVETFRELYPKLRFSGNRAILLDASDKLPESALRHCVALALTYHLNKRKGMRMK
jgi:hypothetical protein